MEAPPTLKLTLIGSSGTGKTSLRSQFLSSSFARSYKATVGVDFLSKSLLIDNTRVLLSIWDTAGQERFRSLANAFYRGSDACVLVFARDDRESLEEMKGWYKEFVEKCPVGEGEERRRFCWVALGNKSDLEGVVGEDEVERVLRELLPPMTMDRTSGEGGGYSVDGDESPALEPPDAHPHQHHLRHSHSTSIEILPPLPPHETTPTKFLRPTSSTLTHSSYHTTPSLRSTLLSSSSYASATSHLSSTSNSTVRPPRSLCSSDGYSSDDSSNEYGHLVQPSSTEQEEEDKKHGIDIFMATSPPRAPPSGLPKPTHRLSTYRNPQSPILRPPSPSPSFSSIPTLSPSSPNNNSQKPDSPPDTPPSLKPSVSPHSSTSPTLSSDDEYDYSLDGIKYFSTSAKTGEGVTDAFEYAVRRVLWRWKRERGEDERREEERRRAEVVDLEEERRAGKKGGWRDACC